MQLLLNNFKTTKYKLTLNLIKIGIIIFMSFSFIGNFNPFFEGGDSRLYGVSAINLANGSFGFTNYFLQETGSIGFVPIAHVKSIDNWAIPIGGVGIYFLSATSFLIAGYYGLFFLGPIFAILLLIFSERITTKLFGSIAGLVALVLISTDNMIFSVGKTLLTDNIFTLFFILGFFYLIRFFHNQKPNYILLCSTFFVIATLFRLNGIVFLPTEILLVAGFFIVTQIFHRNFNNNKTQNEKIQQISSRKITKIPSKSIVALAIPWILLLLFFSSFNSYYFGDYSTNYRDEMELDQDYQRGSYSSFFKLDQERFEWAKFYSMNLLPDKFESFLTKSFPSENSDVRELTWLSSLVFLILISGLIISFLEKKMRIEIIVIIVLALGALAFFSWDYLHPVNFFEADYTPSPITADRYMLAITTSLFMVIGFIFQRFWYLMKGKKILNKTNSIITSKKIIFFVVLILFLVFLLYDSKPVKSTLDFNYNDPALFAERYPLDKEGLTENSIIVGWGGIGALEYNAVPLHPYWGYSVRYQGWNPDLIPQEPIEQIKNLLENEELFVIKNLRKVDPEYFQYLKSEHDILLVDHSKTFCKLVLKNTSNSNSSKNIIKADDECYAKYFPPIRDVYGGEILRKSIQVQP